MFGRFLILHQPGILFLYDSRRSQLVRFYPVPSPRLVLLDHLIPSAATVPMSSACMHASRYGPTWLGWHGLEERRRVRHMAAEGTHIHAGLIPFLLAQFPAAEVPRPMGPTVVGVERLGVSGVWRAGRVVQLVDRGRGRRANHRRCRSASTRVRNSSNASSVRFGQSMGGTFLNVGGLGGFMRAPPRRGPWLMASPLVDTAAARKTHETPD